MSLCLLEFIWDFPCGSPGKRIPLQCRGTGFHPECIWGFPGSAMLKNPPANAGDTRDASSIPGFGRFPWSRKWQPAPLFLPGKSHGQRCLAGYSPWGRKEVDKTEHAHTHTHSPGTFSPVTGLPLHQDKLPTSWSPFPLFWVRTGEGL